MKPAKLKKSKTALNSAKHINISTIMQIGIYVIVNNINAMHYLAQTSNEQSGKIFIYAVGFFLKKMPICTEN